MKTKPYLFTCLLALGLMAAVGGVQYVQSEPSELLACCDPATDPDCDEEEDDDGGNNSDSMPSEIIT